MTSKLRRAMIKFLLKFSAEHYGTHLTVKQISTQGFTLFDSVWLANAIISGPNYSKLYDVDYYNLVHYFNMADLGDLNSPELSVAKSMNPQQLYTMSKFMRELNGIILNYIIVLFATNNVRILFDCTLIEAIEILASSESPELQEVINCELIKSDLWHSHISSNSSIDEILYLSSDFCESKDIMFKELGYEGSSATSVLGSYLNLNKFECFDTLLNETKEDN